MHFRRCRCTGGRAAEPSFWAKNGGHGPMYSARSVRPGSTRYHGGDGEGVMRWMAQQKACSCWAGVMT
jgi:hypothetical protein